MLKEMSEEDRLRKIREIDIGFMILIAVMIIIMIAVVVIAGHGVVSDWVDDHARISNFDVVAAITSKTEEVR